MIKKQIKKELCSYCGGVIFFNKDKYVVLQTNKGTKIMEQNYFHFDCWRKNWQEKIHETIMNRAKIGMEGMFKTLKMLQRNMNKS